MMKYLLLPCALLALQAAAQPAAVPARVRAAMDRIDTNSLRAHVAYLADDRLRGRLPGTEGYQMAVDYVTNQFREMGVKPGGDAGGYTQKLLIRKSVVPPASAYAVLKDRFGNADSLSLVREFTPIPHPMRPSVSAEAGLVFVGYGLDVPGEYSDYNNVDVKGKIVVLLTGAPDGFSSTITAHLSNLGSKFNAAKARGAAGVIVINPTARPNLTVTPVFQGNAALNPDRSAVYSRHFTGNVGVALNGTRTLLARLLMNGGKNIDRVLADLKARKSSSFELPFSIATGYSTTHTDIESYNVIGLIPGDDRRLRKEYVIHSAHLDHLGVGKPVNGDSIYNGAHDNASGVAALLEIARIYRSGVRPKRSILMVLVTGEEMGLIGSSYFAANPTVPKESIVADVNTDMPTVIAPLLAVVPLGAEHSTMMDHVQFAARQLALDVEKDPEPSENRFVRSDQYSFVLAGIPALHIKYGNKSATPGFDLVQFVKQWRAKYYHQTADNLETGIFDFGAHRKYVQFNFLVSYSIAQTGARPTWNKGDLFATPLQ